MGNRAGGRSTGPKCIAIVGPFASGKTSLFEAILERTKAIQKAAKAGSGNTVGDNSPEAKAHQMSVEATVATTSYMGESLTFIDCPGSVEFAHEAEAVLAAADMAIVVAEPDEKKIPALQLVLRRLEDLGLPHMLFLNKIDKASGSVRDILKLLQPASKTPLLLRQIPIWKDGIAIGTIDLASERAYVFREHAESEVIAIPDADKAREVEARYSMLERLSDHDDALMEQLLEEVAPPMDEVFDDLSADLRDGSVVPVFIGAAENGNGITRLLKAIRHDGPDAVSHRQTPRRQGQRAGAAGDEDDPHIPCRQVVRGAGAVGFGCGRNGSVRAAAHRAKSPGFFAMMGKDVKKLASAAIGDTVALGKLDAIATGATLGSAKEAAAPLAKSAKPDAVMSIAVRAKERKDEVKLSAALHRIADEDPSLSVEHNQESAETVIGGQGEMHLRVALERLSGRYGIAIDTHEPLVAWRETIKGSTQVRGRHKKQSGGHGQFGDVVIEIKPLPRGEGFKFTDTVTGGVVPKQYIPSVEEGVRDYLKSGPLGFPLVDLTVNLSEGSYHTVDSSDMAFQLAAKAAMKEGMGVCGSVLLEPVMKVTVTTPESAMASVTTILTQRRGQILGFNPREGWDNWNVIETLMPQAELKGLIVELRSATSGTAGYTAVVRPYGRIVRTARR